MIGKTLLRWAIALIALIAIFIVIMLTPIGLKLSMTLATKLVPGHLQYQKISGIVTGPIEVEGFQYDHDGTCIAIQHFKMNWRPLTLLWGKLTITKLDANRVYLTLGKASSNGNNNFFTISIRHADLHHVAIGRQKNKYPVLIRRAYLDATIVPQKVVVQARLIIVKPMPVQARLYAIGNFSTYKLTMRLKAPHLNWMIYGTGNDQGIHLSTEESKTLDGSLSGRAYIRWSPQLQWDVDLNAQHLNFNQIQEDWPQQLSIKLKSQGKITQQQPIFSLKALISTSKAKVTIIAKQDTALKLQWNAAIEQLATLIPGTRGSLNSSGKWTGSIKRPITQGTIKANNISLFGYQAKTLNGSWDLHPSPSKPSRLSINTTQFVTKGINIPSLKLQAVGSRQSHRLSGTLGIHNAKLIFQLKGSLIGERWQGQLNKLSIVSSRFTNWRLAKPSSLTLSPTQISTPDLCLRSIGTNSNLCLSGQWHRDKAWSFKANGQRFDPGLLTNLFLPKLRLSGKTQVAATIKGFGNKLQTANGTITLGSGRFNYSLNGNNIASPFQRMNMTFNLTQTSLRSTINAILSKNNFIDINLNIPDLKHPAINGRLRSHLSNLNLIANFIPDIVKPNGKLQANLTISGTLKQPRLSGKLKFLQGSVKLARLGIELTNIDLGLSFHKNTITYNAKVFSKKSPIHIKGTSTWTAKGLQSDLSINAKDALIMNTPEYVIYASPQLHFQILNKTINMQGSIDIPKGIIQPHDFSNVVSLPDDQIVYIGKPPVETDKSWQISAKIKVSLGKDVIVDTSGLHATITGQATITGSPQRTALANGRINIVKGKYSAYGKTLTIQSGSYIQFVNSPAANPSLNIRAMKKITVTNLASHQQLGLNDITVGMNVTGTFRKPKIRLFSIPANLSQADILSYLVLGTASNMNSSGNVDLLLEAAGALKFGGSGSGVGGVLSEIKQGLGLTEFGVESESVLGAIGTPYQQQSSFVIGKHLTRRIYIRYSVGLGQGPFAPVNIFQLRYLLSRNWMLQTNSSSMDNGFDILYTIN